MDLLLQSFERHHLVYEQPGGVLELSLEPVDLLILLSQCPLEYAVLYLQRV